MHTTWQTGEAFAFTPAFRDLAIDRAAIERDLGYRRVKIPGSVSLAIDYVLGAASEYLDLECGFVILRPGTVSIGDDEALCGAQRLGIARVIAPLLKDSVTLALFVATAGPRMEHWASSLLKGDEPVMGFVADLIASEIVEQTADWLETRIGETAAGTGWKMTNRYSPGYCGWPTSDQRTLFSLIPPGFCGIRLNESALMVPVKSVSGVIGLGPDVKRSGYQCKICDMEDCFRRRSE